MIPQDATLDGISRIDWSEERQQLTIHIGGGSGPRAHSQSFQRIGHDWKRAAGRAAQEKSQPWVHVRQSLNSPPVVVADSGCTPYEPSPQMRDLPLGQMEVYTWRDSHGVSWEGGLLKPPQRAGVSAPKPMQCCVRAIILPSSSTSRTTRTCCSGPRIGWRPQRELSIGSDSGCWDRKTRTSERQRNTSGGGDCVTGCRKECGAAISLFPRTDHELSRPGLN